MVNRTAQPLPAIQGAITVTDLAGYGCERGSWSNSTNMDAALIRRQRVGRLIYDVGLFGLMLSRNTNGLFAIPG